MRSIRKTVASLALALAVFSILPQPVLAGDETVALRRDGPGTTSTRTVPLDLALLRVAPPSDPMTAAPLPFADVGPMAQASSGWSSYSTSKKTWIIVGIAVGVAAIAVAVSNHHSGGGGGGGY